ncbi:MAG: hypothetical protein Q8R10_07075 [Pseudomonas sp.]|uniref:hypothetical protein n=1 Tax=Pseudomonas sp. TaxID=306 RepID=UPI002732DC85|nr:hypothetical protein [Pseudomonas sp.]MDP3846174.1 hypothetical protein [Pseudomonas sp.]MDZ4262817.1 hypothetical protein [Pseudomonadota bacterium]
MSSKAILWGGGYQAINLILLVVQGLVLPGFLGLDLYGEGLLVSLPIMLFGGVWEPIVHRFYIEGEGLGRNIWFGFFAVFFILYGGYVFFSDLHDAWIVFWVGVIFAVEYMISIFTITKMQKAGQVVFLASVALIGLLVSCFVFLLPVSGFTVIVFFFLYFFPVFVFGMIAFRGDLFSFANGVVFGAFLNGALDALSTRLFYLVINNFYVLFVGVFYGASKAAIIKIVISVCSAFRFSSPYTIGYFYSLAFGRGLFGTLRISLVPLLCFAVSVFIAVSLSWLVDGVGASYFSGDYFQIKNSFASMAWGVPFYLWAPYLTIVFSRGLGFKLIFLISFAAFLIGFFLGVGEGGMFVFACVSYCLLLLLLGFYWRVFR